MAVQPKVARLKNQLMMTGLQQKDNKLFQVIDGLINYIQQLQDATQEEIAVSGGSFDISDKLFLTHGVSSGIPNYRRLLAGIGISFDDTVANERTINNISTGSDWDVLTNGDTTNPELIFADGDVIMLETL